MIAARHEVRALATAHRTNTPRTLVCEDLHKPAMGWWLRHSDGSHSLTGRRGTWVRPSRTLGSDSQVCHPCRANARVQHGDVVSGSRHPAGARCENQPAERCYPGGAKVPAWQEHRPWAAGGGQPILGEGEAMMRLRVAVSMGHARPDCYRTRPVVRRPTGPRRAGPAAAGRLGCGLEGNRAAADQAAPDLAPGTSRLRHRRRAPCQAG
jgi:hypothetical protein